MNNQVKVGLSALIVRDGKVLMGKRKGSHGQGQWAFPGGHLEYSEDFKSCLTREVKEETGLFNLDKN
ncbi:NUDIX domain-containing protein, partial [bacterium]|nr:NUDIX domain-containing protein [bacterium]